MIIGELTTARVTVECVSWSATLSETERRWRDTLYTPTSGTPPTPPASPYAARRRTPRTHHIG